MKIGIVTLYGNNYGNKLQNYALQTLIESLGHEAETILFENGKRLHHIDSKKDVLAKLDPRHIMQALSSRFKNKYPYKNQRDGIWKSVTFAKTKENKRLEERRNSSFKSFSDNFIHSNEGSYNSNECFFYSFRRYL